MIVVFHFLRVSVLEIGDEDLDLFLYSGVESRTGPGEEQHGDD